MEKSAPFLSSTIPFLILLAATASVAYGQQHPWQTPARPSIGFQASPLVGASVRLHLPYHIGVQAAALPLGDLTFIGARLMLRLRKVRHYHIFATAGTTLGLSKNAEGTEKNWLYFAGIGAEAMLGNHVSLSAELNLGHLDYEDNASVDDLTLPLPGFGIHYYF